MGTKKTVKKTKPTVLIALTCQRFVFARTVFSLMHTLRQNQDYEFDFYMEMGADIASSRNRIAAKAKEMNADYLLFVDYDMFFPPYAISELIKADKDIIGAAYDFRKEPAQSTAVPKEDGADTSVPFKVKGIGAGLLLIKTSVFYQIPSPWFMFGYNEKGEMMFGEDSYFVQRAISAGMDVWAHPNLDVKHIGEQLF